MPRKSKQDRATEKVLAEQREKLAVWQALHPEVALPPSAVLTEAAGPADQAASVAREAVTATLRSPFDRTPEWARWIRAVKQLDALEAYGELPAQMDTANGPVDTMAFVTAFRDEVRELVGLFWRDEDGDQSAAAVSQRTERLYERTRDRLVRPAVGG